MAVSGEASLPVNSTREISRGPRPERVTTPVEGSGRELAVRTSPASEEPAEERPVTDPEAAREATARVEEFVQVVQRDLEFSVDEESGRTVVTVTDSESGEVIRQIPPERMLKIAENLDELTGLLFRGSA